jgi:uncharacterized membrane protein YsdA (DUF1294 family)
MKWILIYALAVNIVAFAAMGMDKGRAVRGAWRIPEKTLFFLAIIGGSVGAIFGMQVFRHKTRHPSFVIGMPTILVIQLCLMLYALCR